MIRLLLRLYPAAWQTEYGDELAGLLRSQPLTISAVANVVRSGLRERLRASDPGNFFLLVSFCLGNLYMLVVIARGAIVATSTFLFLWMATLASLFLFISTAIAWSMQRGKSVFRSCGAGLKVGLFMGLCCMHVLDLDPTLYSTILTVPPSPLHPGLYWPPMTILLVAVMALVVGLAIGHLRRRRAA